jgi:cell division cycle 14
MEPSIHPASDRQSYPYPSHVPYQLLFYAWPITLLKYTDRLYLASYINPPTEDTLFPYPEPPVLRSPTKRAQAASSLRPRKQPFYFTIDDQLFYNAFHHDFGPLHIGHLYRFALMFHDILGAKENRDRPVVFWSMADPKSMYFMGESVSCLSG